ncbi:MAG: DUF4199 domain-containing protein, partial [Bacteroidota bacterium]
MKNTILRFGLYGALTICTLFLLEWYAAQGLSYSTKELIGYLSMLVALSFIYVGVKHYRGRYNGGVLSFKKGLVIGLGISLITALAFALLDVLYVTVLNPGFMEDY